MKIGVFSTFVSPIATPDLIMDFGQRVEAAGLDSIWVGEHVVLFDEMEFGYPGTPDGKIPMPPHGGLIDNVAVFGFLAAATKKIRFGTGIALIGQRNPIYTANEFASLDWLSGGRIDFGIGVGWCKEEVIACGYGWQDRGERADEFLDLVKLLWTNEVTTYHGKHFTVDGARLDPKPVQSPHIPIIVGGHSKRAFRRAAEYGQGWYGFGMNPDATGPVVADIEAALKAADRNMEGFEIIITPPGKISADDVKAYADQGVHRLVVHMPHHEPDKLERRLDEVAGLQGVNA